MWHRLRLLCPEPVKIVMRRIRSRLIDPLDRGILIEVSGTQVRTPAYFKGGAGSATKWTASSDSSDG